MSHHLDVFLLYQCCIICILAKAISLCKAIVELCFLLRSCMLYFDLCMTKVHIILIVSHKREPLDQLSHHCALFKFFIFMFYVGVLEKLYVGSLNKNTTKREIEEVSNILHIHTTLSCFLKRNIAFLVLRFQFYYLTIFSFEVLKSH